MGIGRAIGTPLARKGAHVVGVARGRPDLERFLEEARAFSPQSSVFPADVADPEAVTGLFEAIHDRYARRGRIVNVVSGAGRSPLGREGAYCASKAAITAFSESISYELEPFGVQVQVLYPGYVPGTRMAEEAARAPDLPATGRASPTDRPIAMIQDVASFLRYFGGGLPDRG